MLRIPLFCTSTNSLCCFLAHTERGQHLSTEDGLHCPLQIRHLGYDSALLVAKGPSNIEGRAFRNKLEPGLKLSESVKSFNCQLGRLLLDTAFS